MPLARDLEERGVASAVDADDFRRELEPGLEAEQGIRLGPDHMGCSQHVTVIRDDRFGAATRADDDDDDRILGAW